MADTRKIVVEINTKSQTVGANQQSVNQVTSKREREVADNTGEGSLIMAKSVLLNQAINVAKKSIERAVTTSIDRYLTLTEDYMAENTYQNTIMAINKATSFAGSVYVGAKVGAVGGAVGSLVGAGIGAVGWGVNEVISYQSRMSGYYRQINASNITRAYYSKRAGLIDGGRGTDN